MRPERYAYSYASSSGANHSLKSRIWLVALILLAVLLLVMTRAHAPLMTQLRTQLDGLAAPLMRLINSPMRGAQAFVANKKSLLHVYEENKQLSAENDTLRHWQAVAQALKVENDNLRKLAQYAPSDAVNYVTARVIAQSPEAYAGSLLLDAGGAQGLQSLQPVIDAYGLIGRVVDVGDRTARVLLLSDTGSRVPVITGSSRQHAILAGTGDELLRMTFVGGDSQTIALGESVVTTSEGGLIPESVMIGTVFRRDAHGLLVKPVRPLARAEYVRVMMRK